MTKTFIIAEAGVNHNGSLAMALALIDTACAAGADAVKFQTFIPEEVISIHAPKADYQKETTDPSESQIQMVRKFYLSPQQFSTLAAHCKKKGILFLSTPFDLFSIDILTDIGVEIFKIPSGEITNLPYLRKLGKLGKRIIISTGMSTLDEVGTALDALQASGARPSDITLLHCTTQYPAPYESVNLHAMLTMKNAFPTVAGVGYSDHTTGIEVPIAAVSLGASVIEKHFTLDRSLEGPDHKASLEPQSLTEMIRCIRNIEKALGDGIKRPTNSEQPNITIARKSIVAARNIKNGELLTEENITTKRPGNGISPMRWDAIINKIATRDYARDDFICEE